MQAGARVERGREFTALTYRSPGGAEAQYGGHDGHHAASRSACPCTTTCTASTGKLDQPQVALWQMPGQIEHDPHRLRSILQICVASSRSVAITFKTEYKARLSSASL